MNQTITLDRGWLFALVPFALAGITWLWCVLFEAVATMHAWWMRRTVKESSAVALVTDQMRLCVGCMEPAHTYYRVNDAFRCYTCAAALTGAA